MADRASRWSLIVDLITLATVLTGLTFAAIELRQLRSAQEAEGVLALFQLVQTPETVAGLQAVLDIPRGLSAEEIQQVINGPNRQEIFQLQLTFENLGVMVFRDDVSIEWVDEMFRYPVTESWHRLAPHTFEQREATGYSGIWEWHQWLVERLEERGGSDGPTPAYEAHRDWTPPRG